MRPATCALLLLLAASPAAAAQNRQRAVPAFTSREDSGSLARAVLRNGLTIVVEEHVVGPVGAVVARVGFGSLDAPQTPLAAELLARRLGRALEREVRQAGGLFEFRVHPRHTEFVTVVADSNVFRAVAAQAVLLGDPADDGLWSLDLAALQAREATRGPLQEVRSRLAELAFAPPEPPAPEVSTAANPATTDGPPEGAPREPQSPGYSAELLDRLQKRYYRPGNMILAASGNLRRERVLREVVRSMAVVEAADSDAAPSRPEPQPLSGGAFRFSSGKAPVSQQYLLLGYPIPAPGHPDRAAIELLACMLGQGRGALLRLPRGQGAVHPPYRVEVDLVEEPAGHLFRLTAVPSGGLDAAEVHILAAIETLAARGIPPAELDRAKAQWTRQHYLSLERVDDRAVQLADSEALGNYRGRDLQPAAIAGLTSSQLLDVLRRYLRRNRLALMEVLTDSDEERTFTAASFLEALEILIPGQRALEVALLDALAGDLQAPTFQLAAFKPRFTRTRLRQTAILRGPDIWLRERHLMPIATVGFFFSGGRIQESDSTAGLTELMLRALLRGLTRREEGLRYHRLERGGVDLTAVVGDDSFGLRITMLSGHLNEVVRRITEWLRQPDTAIEEVDLEAARHAMLAELRLHVDLEPGALGDTVRRSLYGGHPYAAPPGGSVAVLSTLDLNQIQAWATRLLVDVHPYLIVLGDFEGTSFLQGLVSQLSDRRYQVRGKFDRPFDFEDDSRGQAQAGPFLLLGLPGPDAQSYSRQVLQVAGWLLGGWGGRLSDQLQKQGLAARFDLYSESGLNGGALYFSLESDPLKLPEALKTARSSLTQLSVEQLRQDEVYDALVAAMTRRSLEIEDSSLLLADIMEAILAGEDAGYRERADSIVTSLTVNEVVSVSRRYFVFEP